MAALLLSTVQARAEANRVLPFWAQPFPIGFVRNEPGLASRERCREGRRIRTRHGFRTVVVDRCRPVLHARD